MLDVKRLAEACVDGTKALIARAIEPILRDSTILRADVDSLRERVEVSEASWVDLEKEVIESLSSLENDLPSCREDIRDFKQSIKGLVSDVASLGSDVVALTGDVRSMGDVGQLLVDLGPIERSVSEVRGILDKVSARVSSLEGLPLPERGEPGARGVDGVGLESAKINDDGELVLRTTDHDTINVGRVTGRDGIEISDVSVEYDGDRVFTFKMVAGDLVREFPFKVPFPIYRGTYDPEREYDVGDTVTFAGSQWTAERKILSGERPQDRLDGARAWRLSVKRGRDAKTPVKRGEAS